MIWRKCAMVEKKLVALSLICVVLSVVIVGAILMLSQKDYELQMKADQISGLENERLSLEAQVANLQFNISSLQSEIVSLNNDKNVLEAQAATLQSEITSLTNEKTALENQVSSLQTEATTLEMQVSALQANISSLQTEITLLNNEKLVLENQVSSLQTEIMSLEDEVIESYQVGYDEGYVQGVEDGAGSGWYIRDPTYDEAIAFISLDETDENDYTEDYVCYDFTSDFAGNAFQMGYRCGFVYIEFSETAHAIACFNTTDLGLIYVEPQTDEIVDVAVGQLYDGQVIVRMGIIW
ncbi:MAG TPA: DUF2968 domain-containing protein [Candidatus Bathyarchaeota archaeon]|nr:DUF2968 domain-containing protein [Candidatus Bathyarchaeota archaeon]